jgi:hypothetical protein
MCVELWYETACSSYFRCSVSTSVIYVNQNVRMWCYIGHSTCLSLEYHYFKQRKSYVHSHASQTNKQTNKKESACCSHLVTNILCSPDCKMTPYSHIIYHFQQNTHLYAIMKQPQFFQISQIMKKILSYILLHVATDMGTVCISYLLP